MINILNQPEYLLKGLVISRAPMLYNKRRENRLLIMRPDMGTWTILDDLFQEFYKKTAQPILYKDFIANDQGIPPAMFVAFLEETYNRGMLLLSGKQVEMERTGYCRMKNTPALLHFRFDRGDEGSGQFFLNFLEDTLSKNESNNYHIQLSGNILPCSPSTARLLQEMNSLAGSMKRKIRFSIDITDLSFLEDSEPPEIPLILLFHLDGDESPDKVKHGIEKARKQGFETALTITFKNPSKIAEHTESFLKSGLTNLAIKMDPTVFLGDGSITGTIKLIEDFAAKYLEMVDGVFSRIALAQTNLVLHDIHRFLTKVVGNCYDFPCGSTPCGMGEQVLVITDTGAIFACAPLSQKSGETLSLTKDDIGCPDKSDRLKFWRNDKLKASTRCGRCRWRYFCGGGCPVLTYEKFGQVDREDPRCRFFQMIYEELLWKVYDSPLIVRKLGGLY